MSNATVLKHTGKSWDQWVTILEKARAHSWEHSEIVAFLKKKHKLEFWWQVGVARGFQIAIGRVKPGQNSKGFYPSTTTKSLRLDWHKAWDFLLSPEGLKLWMDPMYPVDIAKGQHFETKDGFYGEVRTLKEGHHARLWWQSQDWEKKTVVIVSVFPQAKGRCVVCFQHDEIPSVKIRDELKKRWKNAGESIKNALHVKGLIPQ